MLTTLRVNKQAVIRAFCYSDIFDYPLTQEEIKKYLIFSSKVSQNDVASLLNNLLKKNIISYKSGMYCLKGREKIFFLRKQREELSQQKIKKAQKIALFISLIPTIQLIGLSGSAAINNAKINDDIDFFIITQEHCLWITRLIVVFLLSMLGVLRKRKIKNAADKICANMYMDSCKLLLPKNKINLYTAHEIVQMKILFVRNNMYYKFIDSNKWVLKYLPNSFKNVSSVKKVNKISFKINLCSFFIYLPEKTAKFIQLYIINKHRTNEFISDFLLAFHPQDKTSFIIKSYYDKLKYYEIRK